MQVLYLFIAGGLGALGRYGLSGLAQRIGDSFPWGTLTVNLLGSLLLGFIMQLGLSTDIIPREARVPTTAGSWRRSWPGAHRTVSFQRELSPYEYVIQPDAPRLDFQRAIMSAPYESPFTGENSSPRRLALKWRRCLRLVDPARWPCLQPRNSGS